jgi:hypothetical protein
MNFKDEYAKVIGFFKGRNINDLQPEEIKKFAPTKEAQYRLILFYELFRCRNDCEVFQVVRSQDLL